jgi:regulation of enolase protein 1 (concanavalin A-like superfamily)
MSTASRAFCVAFTSFVLVAVALAAGEQPVQKIKGWGEVFDPEKDTKLSEGKGKLAITIPADAHRDMWAGKGKITSPRVLQEVEGNFVLQVKVLGVIRPEKNSVIPKTISTSPFQAATLLIWKDDKTFIRLERCGNYNPQTKKNVSFCYLQAFQNDKRLTDKTSRKVVDVTSKADDKETLLRLERRADKFYSSFSQDNGKTWTDLPINPFVMDLPKKVKVGVAACNASTNGLTVEFEGLKIDAK